MAHTSGDMVRENRVSAVRPARSAEEGPGMPMIERIKRGLRALHEDTAGAMSVEKILILALIALPIIIILLLFRKTIVSWFSDQSSQLQP